MNAETLIKILQAVDPKAEIGISYPDRESSHGDMHSTTANAVEFREAMTVSDNVFPARVTIS